MLRGLRHRVHVRLVRTVEQGVDAVLTRRLREVEDRFRSLHDEVAALRTALHDREIRERRDILAAGERDAVRSSARFVRDAMPGARTFPRPAATLEHALRLAPTGGLALEFGVFSGTTLRAIADARGGRAGYGLDSLRGPPEGRRARLGKGAGWGRG